MSRLEFAAVIVGLWVALSVVCGLAWGITGWLARRWFGPGTECDEPDDFEQDAAAHRQYLDAVARGRR